MFAEILRFNKIIQTERMLEGNDALLRTTDSECDYFIRRTTQEIFFTNLAS